MSRGLNKVMLLGNVGADPEIRTTDAGTMLAKFSLATNRSWKDRQGKQHDDVQWHRLTFWGKLAEIVEKYVSKGDRLYVEGRLEYSQTEGDDGVTRYWTDVIVNEMLMLGSKDGSSGGGTSRSTSRPEPEPKGAIDEVDDDLPF